MGSYTEFEATISYPMPEFPRLILQPKVMQLLLDHRLQWGSILFLAGDNLLGYFQR